MSDAISTNIGLGHNELAELIKIREKACVKAKTEYEWAVREFWHDICYSLSSENLHEDGEISNAQAEHKRSLIYADAMKVHSEKHYCPKDIAEHCDDDLFVFVKTEPWYTTG